MSQDSHKYTRDCEAFPISSNSTIAGRAQANVPHVPRFAAVETPAMLHNALGAAAFQQGSLPGSARECCSPGLICEILQLS